MARPNLVIVPKPYDTGRIRADFPILKPGFTYLDTAASAQKPRQVLDAMTSYCENDYSNIHRGLYKTSQTSTALYEAARQDVSDFVNGWGPESVVFTRGTTESINLVAWSYGGAVLKPGDEIVLTMLEHHANIVPWQMIAHQTGAAIRVLPLRADGTLDLEKLPGLLSSKTRIVAFTQISNALGVINPAAEMVRIIRAASPQAVILIDGSQGVVHGSVDLQALDPDFYVFTGHKLYGPTGAGVLMARPELLEAMPPWQGGGDMIEAVSFEHTTFKSGPARFEAGTPDIMAVIGLKAALSYLGAIGMDAVSAHETGLLRQAAETLKAIPGVRIHAPDAARAGIVSFEVEGAHHSDVAMLLDQENIAVRTGHHCCMPLMKALGTEGTIRVSLGAYTNADDIERLGQGLEKACRLLSRGKKR